MRNSLIASRRLPYSECGRRLRLIVSQIVCVFMYTSLFVTCCVQEMLSTLRSSRVWRPSNHSCVLLVIVHVSTP